MNTITVIAEQINKTRAAHPTTLNGLPGMTSQEIAEITGKSHKNVLRDIRKMLDELGLSDQSKSEPVNELKSEPVAFAEVQCLDAKGELRPMMILDKRRTFVLLSRYSFKLSDLIVGRWLELEGSGFARVSVQEAVVELVAREKDNRAAALRGLKNRGEINSQRGLRAAVERGNLTLEKAKALGLKTPKARQKVKP